MDPGTGPPGRGSDGPAESGRGSVDHNDWEGWESHHTEAHSPDPVAVRRGARRGGKCPQKGVPYEEVKGLV